MIEIADQKRYYDHKYRHKISIRECSFFGNGTKLEIMKIVEMIYSNTDKTVTVLSLVFFIK